MSWQAAGFVQGEPVVPLALHKLLAYIERTQQILEKVPHTELLLKENENRWSIQQVMGHLVDSAIYNLQRFTSIQFLPSPYVLVSYPQNELVAVNHYQDLPIAHIVQLWSSLNRQIHHVISHCPAEKLLLPVNPNYDDGEMRTLGWLFADYVAHMEHHFKPIPVLSKLVDQVLHQSEISKNG